MLFGKNIRFIGRHVFDIHPLGEISIGDDFISRSGHKNHIVGNKLTTIMIREGAVLEIGRNTGISCSSILCANNIKIGSYTNIGAGCLIMDSNFHSSEWNDRFDRAKDKDLNPKPVKIGDNTFIGANCNIT